jgi:uncharacterized protein (TIGR02421 family)
MRGRAQDTARRILAPMTDKHLARLLELDAELVEAARGVRVLNAIAWPASAEQRFLAAWRAGRPELPEVAPKALTGNPQAALAAIQARCDRGHPLGEYLYRTAGSYRTAADMLAAAGTPEFTRHSITLYGRPDDQYRTQDWTGVDAAKFFLDTTDELLGNFVIPPTRADIPADQFAARLEADVNAFFTADKVRVVLDPELASKAIAGATRIRVRAGALFSGLDYAQLLHHEAYVHVATALNGKRQPQVRSLGLGPPRTTRTQEGIALFAEFMTRSIDIRRLRRITLRVSALDAALNGADFIEVFKLFLAAGQAEDESFQSAMRIFRGGDVRGRIAFTKDCVYLKGLLEVHAFLRIAIRDNRPELVRNLFAGRMTLGDAITLGPLFESGVLAGPAYLPDWAAELRVLAALMAYSSFMARVQLGELTLDHFVSAEEWLARAQ